MSIRIFVASALALAVIAPVSANALTIDNKDKTAYTLKVTPKGGTAMELAVKPSAKADVDCKLGCTISLGSKVENVTAKTAKLTIKGGKLML